MRVAAALHLRPAGFPDLHRSGTSLGAAVVQCCSPIKVLQRVDEWQNGDSLHVGAVMLPWLYCHDSHYS